MTKINIKKHHAIVIFIFMLLVCAGVIIWVVHNRDDKPSIVSTTKNNPDSKVAPNNSRGTSSSTGTNTANSQTANYANSNSIQSIPQAPSGQFVSNHKPGQNGSPLSEVSICTVTTGVTCTIEFSQGSITKQLPPQTASSNTGLSWTWTPEQVGLNTGNWTVTVVASENGRSSTTKDPDPLVIM